MPAGEYETMSESTKDETLNPTPEAEDQETETVEDTPTDAPPPEEATPEAAEAPADEVPVEDSEVEEAPEAAAEAPEEDAVATPEEAPEPTEPVVEEKAEPGLPAALDPKARAPFASGDLYSDSYGEEEFDLTRGDFEAMLSEHQSAYGEVKEGEIVRAKVLRVMDSSIILDFGFKSEGSIPRDEFKDTDEIEVGQEVEVLLEILENDEG